MFFCGNILLLCSLACIEHDAHLNVVPLLHCAHYLFLPCSFGRLTGRMWTYENWTG
jgi:hypothetical protein